jgi:uncharacterized protein YdhG (YjbR/CyaY superfamily)
VDSYRLEGPLAGPSTVEEYIDNLPPERRGPFAELRRAVTEAAPEATESIAYQMPALRSHGGQFLVSYASYTRHYSLFPASEAVIEELGADLVPHLSGKGTIQFRADEPIPLELVKRVVEIRVRENAARATAR